MAPDSTKKVWHCPRRCRTNHQDPHQMSRCSSCGLHLRSSSFSSRTPPPPQSPQLHGALTIPCLLIYPNKLSMNPSTAAINGQRSVIHRLRIIRSMSLSRIIHSLVQSNSRARDSMSTWEKRSTTEPALKKPRIETPSPLPTFKVRSNGKNQEDLAMKL